MRSAAKRVLMQMACFGWKVGAVPIRSPPPSSFSLNSRVIPRGIFACEIGVCCGIASPLEGLVGAESAVDTLGVSGWSSHPHVASDMRFLFSMSRWRGASDGERMSWR